MEEKISVENGKHTLVYNSENIELYSLRYNDYWRNLIGDKMVFALFFEIQRLKEKCGEKYE